MGLTKYQGAPAIRVLPDHIQNLEVEHFLKVEVVVCRLKAKNYFMEFCGSVLLAEDADEVGRDFEPLGDLLDVGDGGRYGHDADGGVDAHDAAHDCL